MAQYKGFAAFAMARRKKNLLQKSGEKTLEKSFLCCDFVALVCFLFRSGLGRLFCLSRILEKIKI
ncbi:MAG: hypothetical protein ACRC7P_08000 [Enterovibrio sp.]